MKNIITLILMVISSFSPICAQLVITEFSYNPPEGGTDTLEYIELYNAGTSKIQLYKYKFSAGVEFTFPDISIDTAQYLILTVNDTAFFRVYGKQSLQWTSGALNNGGEIVSIVDSLGNPVISVDLKDKAPWPTVADGTDGEGRSIEICNPLADPNKGENWKASVKDLGFQVNGKQVYGTPGAKNTIPTCSEEADVTVEVTSNIFTPKDITIDVGQTVRWVNKGGTHNINGTQATFPNNPESFGNGAPSAGWSYDFTFNKEGFYNYQCDPHASLGMTGTVTVKGMVVTEPYPLRSIDKVTTTNAAGVIDSLNVNCTLKGVVYGVNLRPAGLQFTIIDAQNNGIGAFTNSGNFDYTVKEGDEVEIKGQVVQFNGLTQMTLAGVKKISENNTLIQPKEILSFEEADESSLVTLGYVSFVDPSQWTGTGAGFNVFMTNGSFNFLIRIDNDIDAYSAPIPSGAESWFVTGILGQFDSSEPYTEGYQLLPRYLVDFNPAGSASDLVLDRDLKAVPNPITNTLTIQTTASPDLIVVFNNKGEKIQEVKGTLEIDMSGFASGLYLVKAIKGNKTSSVKVIKM